MKEASIEEKVDLLISGMKLPRKRTRRRVATMTGSILLSIALIAGASLVGFYYVQTGEIDVTSLITIDGNDAGWEEGITIGGELDPIFYAGTTYTSDTHTIAYANTGSNVATTVHIHITVTENGELITNGDDGLLVEVVGVGGEPINSQILMPPGTYADFEIQVTADEHINAASTYGYTITMDWNI